MKNKAKNQLADLLAQIKEPRLMALFLADLLTPAELAEINRRLKIIKLLKQDMPQRAVAKKLRIAIATITRGARVLKNPQGGFNKVFKS
jgi:Trp operon repressor